ncbi:MAG: Ig-like domain repeat protein [Planctomycetaceae bacterium]|nr:Ig-like domain repeat protein [Planctomycetaceae bacterium]
MSSATVPLTVINGVDEATFTTTLAAGTYTITAVYDGDSDFTTSTSSVLRQRVG